MKNGLEVGKGLIGLDLVLLGLWSIFAIIEITTRTSNDEESLNSRLVLEMLIVATHFNTIMSMTQLFHELSEICETGKCKKARAVMAWIVPPTVAVVFDLFTLVRAVIFFSAHTFYVALSGINLVSSFFALIWCTWVLLKLKQRRKK